MCSHIVGSCWVDKKGSFYRYITSSCMKNKYCFVFGKLSVGLYYKQTNFYLFIILLFCLPFRLYNIKFLVIKFLLDFQKYCWKMDKIQIEFKLKLFLFILYNLGIF